MISPVQLSSPRRRLRVLHVAESDEGGGAERVFRASVEAGRAAGHEIDTFVPKKRFPTPVSYVFSVRHASEISARIDRFSPDVVHIQNYYHQLSPSVLWGIRRARKRHWNGAVIFTAHDYHIVCPNSGFQTFNRGRAANIDPNADVIPILRRYDHRSLAHSFLKSAQHGFNYRYLGLRSEIDKIVSPSHFLADVIERHLSVPVAIVRNPIDSVFAIPDGSGSDGSRTDQIGANANPTPELVYMGRLTPEKGLRELFQSLDRLTRTGELPDRLTLTVFGIGPDEKALRKLASNLSQLSVEFEGLVDSATLARRIRRAKAVILPSRWYEVSPLSLIEAANVGAPVVVPDMGGLSETAAFGRVFFLYRLDDDASLARALRGALTSPTRNSLIDPSQFAADRYGRALEEVYYSTLRRRP